MIKYTQTCRLCHSPYFREVLNLGHNHIQGAFVTKNNPNSSKRKIPNVIVRCDPQKGGCGLVQSNITCPPEILFSSYFYRSGVNEIMRFHIKSVVDGLLEFNSQPQTVLDIASNDNTLLLSYPQHTEKWGIEPNNIGRSDEKNNIKVINDFFPTKKLFQKFLTFDFITALAVVYDLDDPVSFVREVIVRLSGNGIFCFEVMYLPTMMKNLNWDTFLFEHLTHWSVFTLERLINKAGGKIFDVKLTETNGGSILVFATFDYCDIYDTPERQLNILNIKKVEFDMALDEEATFTTFRERVNQYRRDLKQVLSELKSEGKKICLYGNSTKSNVIVESCGIENYFSYGIERSEEKFGGFTLWGLLMKSEEEARLEIDNNTVWMIGPYFFKKNILMREKESFDKGLKMLFPLPEILLIDKNNYHKHII